MHHLAVSEIKVFIFAQSLFCFAYSTVKLRVCFVNFASSFYRLIFGYDFPSTHHPPIQHSSQLPALREIIRELRKHDGYRDENVTSKYKFELFVVLHDYSILFILCNMSEVSYNWVGTDGFEVKSETERFTVVCPRCRQNLKFGHFT